MNSERRQAASAPDGRTVLTSWQVACYDAVGRLRVLTAQFTAAGHVALTFPPGQAAVLDRVAAEVLEIVATTLSRDLR